jgi:hypothetical protein
MFSSRATIDPAKVKAVADLLTRSQAGRALLDGLTDARLGNLDETLSTIATAVKTARDEVRELKAAWRDTQNTDDMAALASSLSTANETVLEASRRLRVMTMGLREGGIDERVCTLIDQQVTHVLVACEGHEYSADELGRMASKLGALEGSIARLSGAKPPKPTVPGKRAAG